MATPQAGKHADFYEIQELLIETFALRTDAGLGLNGVFLSDDAGFDAEAIRQLCAEKNTELYLAETKRNEKEHNEKIFNGINCSINNAFSSNNQRAAGRLDKPAWCAIKSISIPGWPLTSCLWTTF